LAWIASFLLAFFALSFASAEAPVTTVLVVETPDEIDGDSLRAALSRELGVIAIAPTDPREARRSGTVRVRIDPSKGQLGVEYEERPRMIARTVPMPPGQEAVLKSAVFLAGNLARDEAADLTRTLRRSVPPVAEVPPTPEAEWEPPPKPARTIKRLWFGLVGEMDGLSLPSDLQRNSCIVWTTDYYCTSSDGRDYQPNLNDYYPVQGGVAIGNSRLVVSGDYALSDHWMVGARLGFAAQRYPGSRAPKQDFNMGRFHFELRTLAAFGERGLASWLAPYVIFAVGAAQFDAKVDVGFDGVQAWKVYGPVFTSVGLGLRWAVASDLALMTTPAKVTLVFPYETTFVWSPELGLQVGF
jgi:hypothetical protein